MDYDLSRLSARSFEHLVQSLAVKHLGQNVSIFGDGPDGGREATFERLSAYPSSEEPWADYGIVQAKFRQKPIGASADGQWVIAELTKELKKFNSPSRKLRSPRYYIIATNIALSSVANNGAKDKVATLFDSYRLKIGLRDYRIWDYDQLRVMLDDAGDIRRLYAAWITPGDVISILLERLQIKESSFRKTIINFLQKELHSDELIRLGQAGATDRDSTQLAKVFTDLPIDNTENEDSYDGVDDLKGLGENQRYAVRSLVEVGNDRLTKSAASVNLKSDNAERRDFSGRIVFLGGPGQGKTTISQFVCQLHRAAILRCLCSETMLPETRNAADSLLTQAKAEGIDVPILARFPIRIVLNHFAADLSDGLVDSIIQYIRKKLEQRTQVSVSCEILREWLAAYPWLIVLDGLDEVPGASNRDQVLAAVHDFLLDVNDLDADVLLVSTTRPQGYNEEFSPENFSHRILSHLTTSQALKYAERLVRQRWGEDAEKISVLMQRLEGASKESSTARLMRSPLQVTIMALLVESMGRPPRERWKLFREYFQVITRREKERPIPSAVLLNTIEPDINYIHKAVGFELQRISELSGHTDAALSSEDFAKIVSARLESEGHSGPAKKKLANEITTAALERLVFLVSPRFGQIGFEIRSLQEFMAAEFLTDGSDSDVLDRLQAVATASHWRNVFLFAAGRCFHERQHLRRPLYSILCELNEFTSHDKALNSATLVGSKLALEILEDGSLSQQPEQLSLYKRLAIRLIELPSAPEHPRLADQYDDRHREIFESTLDASTTSHRNPGFIGGWRVLTHLADIGVDWADEMIGRNWPIESSQLIVVLSSIDRMRSEIVSSRCIQFCLKNSPVLVGDVLMREGRQRVLPSGMPTWMRQVLDADDRILSHGAKIQGVGELFSLRYCEVMDFDESGEETADNSQCGEDAIDEVAAGTHPGWIWLSGVYAFRKRPTKKALAKLIRDYKSYKFEAEESVKLLSKNVPWPIASVISALNQGCDVDNLLASAEAGMLGSNSDWVAAQRRWEKKGITKEDLVAFMSRGRPYDERISEVGFPLAPGGATVSHGGDFPLVLDGLVNIWTMLPMCAARRAVANQIIFVASVADGSAANRSNAFANSFGAILAETGRVWVRIELLCGLPSSYWEGQSVIEDIEKFASFNIASSRRGDVGEFWPLERLLIQHPGNTSVAKCLAAAIVAGYKPKLNVNPIMYLEDNSSAERKSYFVIIALALNLVNESNLEIVFNSVAKSISVVNFVDQFCSFAVRSGARVGFIERVLVDMYRRMPQDEYEGRRKLMKAMAELHGRYVSKLGLSAL